MDNRKKNEKYNALKNYIFDYDYENLSVLMFSKEDARYLYEACGKQIAEKAHVNKHNTNILYCATCERQCRKGYDLYCSGCGQKLSYDELDN